MRRLVSTFLGREGFEVREAACGQDMRRALAQRMPDLVVLDLMLPDEDGLELARELRASADPDVAIIMLTGKHSVVDRVVGLEVGADDYIVKPFDVRELLARIKTVLRRTMQPCAPRRRSAKRATFRNWVVDFVSSELTAADGTRINTTGNEFQLLAFLIQRAPRTVSRQEISEHVLGRNWTPADRSSDVLVAKLRKKISAANCGSALIKTVRGAGYKFATDVEFD
ncbi:MAG: response regulator transcription factor [Gammaproteobacteria bacterium]|nr:response regulator transcription factor [Gammaproteobacteria bacterium]